MLSGSAPLPPALALALALYLVLAALPSLSFPLRPSSSAGSPLLRSNRLSNRVSIRPLPTPPANPAVFGIRPSPGLERGLRQSNGFSRIPFSPHVLPSLAYRFKPQDLIRSYRNLERLYTNLAIQHALDTRPGTFLCSSCFIPLKPRPHWQRQNRIQSPRKQSRHSRFRYRSTDRPSR